MSQYLNFLSNFASVHTTESTIHNFEQIDRRSNSNKMILNFITPLCRTPILLVKRIALVLNGLNKIV